MPARDSHSTVANRKAPRPPLGDVCRGSDNLERVAASVAHQVASAARLPPADRRKTDVGSPSLRADTGTVHAPARPVEFAGRVQLGKQNAVQLVEDTGRLPATGVTAEEGGSTAAPPLPQPL